MNMSRLRRALERGNKVVLFDKVQDPLRPRSRILYESYAVLRSSRTSRNPGIPTEAEPATSFSRRGQGGRRSGPGPVAGRGRSPSRTGGLGRAPGRLLDRGGVRRDRPGRQLRPRRLRRLLRRPGVRRFHLLPLTLCLAMIRA